MKRYYVYVYMRESFVEKKVVYMYMFVMGNFGFFGRRRMMNAACGARLFRLVSHCFFDLTRNEVGTLWIPAYLVTSSAKMQENKNRMKNTREQNRILAMDFFSGLWTKAVFSCLLILPLPFLAFPRYLPSLPFVRMRARP